MMLALLVGSAVRSTLLGLIAGGVLWIIRIRRPDARMTAWTVVLLMAAATPALTPWMKIAIPLPGPEARVTWTDALTPVQIEPTIDPPQIIAPVSARHGEWQTWMIGLYAVGAGAMLIRIGFGLMLSLLLVRASRPLYRVMNDGLTVRVSSVLKTPATFGSTIFLPAGHHEWSKDTWRAVLRHEGSHVANRDFYILLLASLYRAAFWFNPFAWWLEHHLTDLAEMVADDTAARALGDRGRYAEILADIARRPDRLLAGLAMAGPGAIEWRIRRQRLAGVPVDATRRGPRIAIASLLVPCAMLSAATFTRTVVPSSADQARAIWVANGRRAATAADHFRRQTPLPGGEAALRQELLSLCCGGPSYAQIGALLSARLTKPNSGLQNALIRFGAPKALTFEGVGPGSFDLYHVQFDHGSAAARIYLAPDGTIDDLSLTPAGDGTPGGLMSCARAGSLFAPHEPVMTSVHVANESGAAVDLFVLHEVGREHRATVPDGERTALWVGVNLPLLVSDAAGRCLGIILPGTKTRANLVGPGGVLNVVRQTAFPGGADFLAQYLDGVRRGAGSYDRMTPEAAATLRGQEPHRRGILQQLGALEDLQFQGVSGLGDDIYRARFVNGSAEWRITFRADGRVSGIVLGPVPRRSSDH